MRQFFARPAFASTLALPFFLASLSSAQLRVVQYNVTNYAGPNAARDAAFQTALFGSFQGRSASPDIFVGEEFISASALTNFVNKMNQAPGSPGDYVAAPFIDGPDTDTVFIYRPSKVTLIGNPVVVAVGGGNPINPRNIMRYDVQIVGYSSLGASISIYGSHMKAGTSTNPSDEARRLYEAQKIRTNAETLSRPFMVCGDLNCRDSGDQGIAWLLASQTDNSGRLFDPIKTPGTWYSNSSMKFVHTQDPVIGQAGMDDRFDFILLSAALIDGDGLDYIGNPNIAYSTTTWNDPNHSYRCWGNDGTSYNQSIKITGNTMVGSAIAQSLTDDAGGQSGHLPVLLDMRVPPKIGAPPTLAFGSTKLFRPKTVMLTVSHDGDLAKWTSNGLAPLKFTMAASAGFSVVGTQQTISPGSSLSFPVTMSAQSSGLKTGAITITTNDPDHPVKTVTLSGAVFGPELISPAH